MSKIPFTHTSSHIPGFRNTSGLPTTSTTRPGAQNIALSGLYALGLTISSIKSIIRASNRLKPFNNPKLGPRTQQAIFGLCINGKTWSFSSKLKACKICSNCSENEGELARTNIRLLWTKLKSIFMHLSSLGKGNKHPRHKKKLYCL